MYFALEEIFAIGIGPSSSHTVGPMKAAKLYIDNIIKKNLLDSVDRLKVDLYGSLALTGIGHGTLRAIVYGLMGFTAEEIDIEQPYYDSVERDKKLHLAQKRVVNFDVATDMVLNKETFLKEHSNGMMFSAFDVNGKEILKEVYFSIGGGTIINQDEFGKHAEHIIYNVPHQFDTCSDLQNICSKYNLSFSEVVLQNEVCLKEERQVFAYLKNIYNVMNDAIERGMRKHGVLPGGLEVKRRAPEIYDKLKEKFLDNQQDGLEVIDWINLWGFAAAEENAAGGRVVTAPTMGSAGIFPAVVRYFERFASHTSPLSVEDGIVKFLTTAAAICSLYRTNASISGAEVGCQGEVGVACSMAAAGLTAAMGGTNAQIEQAAEIAMEHNLGLTCDPVDGLVQIPCIERNAMGAVKAINSARLALRGNGKHVVSLDSVIKTMYHTGKDMSNRYKETSLGGLAVNIVTC
ncbi:MAG: L-serine ammonia-lyase [Alphaproteobacteria bacterium]|nr:L-serine ammonia-lyase [Alphaproteobacteria bacterium]